MTTKLPDLPDMGAVTLVEAERIVATATGASFAVMTSPYVKAALPVLPRNNSARVDFEAAVSQRRQMAQERVTAATPIAAGTYPPSTTYRTTMSEEQARRVLRRATHDRDLEYLLGDYCLAAVQTLSSSDQARVNWQERVDHLTEREQDIVDNGATMIADFDAGPVPV